MAGTAGQDGEPRQADTRQGRLCRLTDATSRMRGQRGPAIPGPLNLSRYFGDCSRPAYTGWRNGAELRPVRGRGSAFFAPSAGGGRSSSKKGLSGQAAVLCGGTGDPERRLSRAADPGAGLTAERPWGRPSAGSPGGFRCDIPAHAWYPGPRAAPEPRGSPAPFIRAVPMERSLGPRSLSMSPARRKGADRRQIRRSGLKSAGFHCRILLKTVRRLRRKAPAGGEDRAARPSRPPGIGHIPQKIPADSVLFGESYGIFPFPGKITAKAFSGAGKKAVLKKPRISSMMNPSKASHGRGIQEEKRYGKRLAGS